MFMTECKNCHRYGDSRGFRTCACCGAMLCDDCANDHDGLCFDCDDRDQERCRASDR